MTRVVFSFIKRIHDAISVQQAFVVFVALVVSGFVLGLVLLVLVNDYARKNRVWFVFLSGALVLFQTAWCVHLKASSVYAICLAGVCLVLFIPTFAPSGKRRKLKKEEKELVRFLQDKISNASENQTRGEPSLIEKQLKASDEQPFMVDKLQVKPLTQTIQELPPDFTHVKNVLERLNYFPLTPTEKKQARELEITVQRIENGENSTELKNRVNDGLGALLKIMAKHGV